MPLKIEPFYHNLRGPGITACSKISTNYPPSGFCTAVLASNLELETGYLALCVGLAAFCRNNTFYVQCQAGVTEVCPFHHWQVLHMTTLVVCDIPSFSDVHAVMLNKHGKCNHLTGACQLLLKADIQKINCPMSRRLSWHSITILLNICSVTDHVDCVGEDAAMLMDLMHI